MIDEKKITQRIYVKDYQLATCETDGIADARINAVPYKGGRGKLCEYINIDFLWHDASEEPQKDQPFITQWKNLWIIDINRSIFPNNDWFSHCKKAKIKQWAYIADLLPKGGEK